MKVTRLRLIALSIALTAIVVAGVVGARSLGAKVDNRDPDSLLKYADTLSWNNNWIKAEPFYHQAELLFAKQHRDSKALYARVSQIPPNSESSSLSATIFGLTNDLALPSRIGNSKLSNSTTALSMPMPMNAERMCSVVEISTPFFIKLVA